MPPPFASRCCANASALHRKQMRKKHEAFAQLYSPEFGLYYALSPAYKRQGYATEAAQALINYAFTHLHLKQSVTTTTTGNEASIGVMRKVGMRIEKNTSPDPPGFQVVGILEN